MALVSVSKILMIAFCHMVIPGINCYSCLWLELVPLMILLASISRPGRLDLSSSFSGQSTLCRQPLLLQGSCTDIWHSNLPPGRRWRPKTGLVPEAVNFCRLHSHLCRLVSVGSGNQDGSPRCSCKAFLGRVDTSPLAGKLLRCLEPEMGSAPEAVSLLPVPEAVKFL